MIGHHASLIFSDLDEINNIEVCLGGDHGKGAFSFMCAVIVWYSANNRNAKVFEFQIGQIESTKDKIELLQPLMEKMKPGVKELVGILEDGSANNTGRLTVHVEEQQQGLLGLTFSGATDADVNNKFKVPTELFLMGDLNFLFMYFGRVGYSGYHCLFCKQNKTEWTTRYTCTPGTTSNQRIEKWTVHNILTEHMQNQENLEMPENERTKQSSSTISSEPLWHFIPVQNVVIPLLHITLGLANNVLDSFLEWIDEMVEPMTKEEQQARTLAILAEIDLDNSVEQEHLHKESYKAKMDERQAVNAELQVRPLPVTCRDEL